MQPPIVPLRFLIPTNYPKSSPIILDMAPSELRLDEIVVIFMLRGLGSPLPSLSDLHFFLFNHVFP